MIDLIVKSDAFNIIMFITKSYARAQPFWFNIGPLLRHSMLILTGFLICKIRRDIKYGTGSHTVRA
jgi:hypothetical protein